MDNNKETKKGFWANLFSSKSKCPCADKLTGEESATLRMPCSGGSEVAQHQAAACCDTPAEARVPEVIVLGPGCAKCRETFKVVERVAAENRLEIKLSKIEDIVDIMSYNIITTPAVVVDGSVKIKGHVPTADEVKKALGV